MNATTNKGRRFPPEVLEENEVQKLLRACSHKAPTGVRNRALIVTMYRGGLRVSEALALKPKDLDRQAGTIRILEGKGRKSRTIGLDPGAFSAVENWLNMRTKLGINGHAPLFCTLRKKSLASAYVRGLMVRLAVKAGIEKRVHAHGLRHTHAAELAREGVPINVIQAQLGHSNVATTSRYLQHIAPQEVVRAIQSREWSAE